MAYKLLKVKSEELLAASPESRRDATVFSVSSAAVKLEVDEPKKYQHVKREPGVYSENESQQRSKNRKPALAPTLVSTSTSTKTSATPRSTLSSMKRAPTSKVSTRPSSTTTKAPIAKPFEASPSSTLDDNEKQSELINSELRELLEYVKMVCDRSVRATQLLERIPTEMQSMHDKHFGTFHSEVIVEDVKKESKALCAELFSTTKFLEEIIHSSQDMNKWYSKLRVNRKHFIYANEAIQSADAQYKEKFDEKKKPRSLKQDVLQIFSEHRSTYKNKVRNYLEEAFGFQTNKKMSSEAWSEMVTRRLWELSTTVRELLDSFLKMRNSTVSDAALALTYAHMWMRGDFDHKQCKKNDYEKIINSLFFDVARDSTFDGFLELYDSQDPEFKLEITKAQYDAEREVEGEGKSESEVEDEAQGDSNLSDEYQSDDERLNDDIMLE